MMTRMWTTTRKKVPKMERLRRRKKKDTKEAANGASSSNGKELDTIKEGSDEADSTGEAEQAQSDEKPSKKVPTGVDEVSSSNGGGGAAVNDDERPSTSNGEVTASCSNGAAPAVEEEPEEEEGVSGSLQLAWEILEAAAQIFSRQGLSGLPTWLRFRLSWLTLSLRMEY